MITSRVSAIDGFGKLIADVERRATRGLNDAAHVAAATFAERASGIPGSDPVVIPAQGIHDGFRSGIRARGPLWRVFDKGSLGKRTSQLKRPGQRKQTWTVRRGGTEYQAHRHDTDGKGIRARDISNPARAAGRRILIRSIRG